MRAFGVAARLWRSDARRTSLWRVDNHGLEATAQQCSVQFYASTSVCRSAPQRRNEEDERSGPSSSSGAEASNSVTKQSPPNPYTVETEKRRTFVQRATDKERRGDIDYDGSEGAAPDEELRWWPPVNQNYSSHMFHRGFFDRNVKRRDGLNVKEIKEVPSNTTPQIVGPADANAFEDASSPSPFASLEGAGAANEYTKRLVPPPTFDPAVDDIDEEGFNDQSVMIEVQRAVESDRKRLEAFGNPVTVADQVDYLLQPQRDGDNNNAAQRQEFNGFVHWGLLHAANMMLDENQDVKKAHELVNRYMRDLDLFQAWLKHPKVTAHLQKKFQVDAAAKYDKLMGHVMSMYTRSKIQVYEDDAGGALKSLTAAMAMLSEGGDLKLARHRKALGAVLVARGMVYCKLKSYEAAESDLTRALAFVNANRSATLYQLRAEALEGLGRIEEARADEERAAVIWEEADVVHAGLEGAGKKFLR